MTVLGSVFLGDAHQYRVFSTTPPTSPPPLSPSISRTLRAQQAQPAPAAHPTHPDMQLPPSPLETKQSPLPEVSPPPEISPAVSLELRVRWLEALLLGVRQEATKERQKSVRRGKDAKEDQRKETLYRRAEDVQRRLEEAVESNDGLRRFMDEYDQYAQFLSPSFALSGLPSTPTTPPSYSTMSSTELDALLSEMEGDIRAADRDLREIDTLEKRGVTGAGRLADHEALQPRLEALVKAHEEDLAKASSLENRIGVLLEKHATRVDALSELFVAWNDVITESEDKIAKALRERQEQKRLGIE